MINKLIFIVGIDGVLITYPENNNFDSMDMYREATPNKKEIKLLNKLFKDGHHIILNTTREWRQYNLTVKQLEHFGINYHSLIMGKPDGIYINKDSFKSIEEVCNA